MLKFSVSRTGLRLIEYFTPGNEAQLSLNDNDLSGSSFTLLPGTNLLLGGGKEGVLYLLNAANLRGKVANDTQIVQKVNVNGGHVMGGPVFWESSTANTSFSAVFRRAANGPGNYVGFTMTGTAFTITAKPLKADTATLRAAVNGIQIVPRVTAPAAEQSVP